MAAAHTILHQPFDYRRTFLHRHIDEELCRIDDVLSVKELVDSYLQKLNEPQHGVSRRRLLESFFQQTGDVGVYIPVQVVERSEKNSNPPTYADLTTLIETLRRNNSPQGIVLEARSGAGKTVAKRRAFFDCFSKNSAEEPARLAGYLPCFAQVGGALPAYDKPIEKRSQLEHVQVVLQLIAHTAKLIDWAADVDGSHWNSLEPRLQQWLKCGPKILLFIDLNAAANAAERSDLAAGLKQFQRHFGRLGHRVIVAYRSAAFDDGILHDLGAFDSTVFGRYDMTALKPAQAEQYLRSLRAFEEREITCHGGVLPPSRDIEAEVKTLSNLIRRHVRESVGSKTPESPISTPLLMHLFSLIDGSKLTADASLAELYDAVVERYLRRELYGPNRPANIKDAQWREWQLVGMVRLALLIQAQGATATRTDASMYDKAIKHPQRGKSLPSEGSSDVQPWWPSDPFWHASAYFDNSELDRPTPPPTDALRAAGLFRNEGEQLGFVHDSFLYYFLGAHAIRHPLGPLNSGIDPEWYDKAVERMRDNAEGWHLPAEFLGGSLDSPTIRELIIRMTTHAEPVGLPQLLLNVCRGRGRRDRVADFLYQDHLRQGWWTLRQPKHAACLISDVYSRLFSSGTLELVAYAHAIARHANDYFPHRRWLRTQHPRFRSTGILTMDHHADRVTCLAALPNGRIVSGCDDGTVKLWCPATGEVREIIRHEDRVTCLALLPDGRIASRSRDGLVKLWDPATCEVGEIILHDSGVTCIAVLPDGRIALGGTDNTVKLWDPATCFFREIVRHGRCVRCIAVLPDGRIATGSNDKTVILWDPATDEVQEIIRHYSGVGCLAVSTDGRIASGSDDNTVKLWDPDTGEVQQIIYHGGYVNCLAALPDGKIASGGGDVTVKLWDPATGVVQQIIHHCSWVNCLAALHDGRIASGGGDNIVKLWAPMTGAVQEIIQHVDSVRSLAVLPDGRVASGSDDKAVKLWDPALGEEPESIRLHDSVRCLVVLPDGRIASGSGDHTVKLYDPATGVIQEIIRHNNGVTCLALLPDGRIASGSSDRTVKLWEPASGAVQGIIHHDNWISCLAVLADGRIIAGSGDRPAKLWDPATGAVQEILSHFSGGVGCLAVLPDGRIASGNYDNTVKLWDPATGVVQEIMRQEGSIRCLIVLSDGRIASGSVGNSVKLWNPATGAVQDIIRHENSVSSLAVLPDGRIASGSGDNTVKLWDPSLSRGKRADQEIIRHEDGVNCLAVLPDGRIASGGGDKAVKLWDPTKGESVLTIPLGVPVTRLVYEPKHRLLVAGLANGEIVMLAIEPEASRLREQRETNRERTSPAS